MDMELFRAMDVRNLDIKMFLDKHTETIEYVKK